MDALEKHLTINTLLSHYRELLTEKQKTIMHYYYEENFTLKEIAENENISRNAVHDQLQKTVKKLEDLEEKLGLVKKSRKRMEIIEAMKDRCKDEELSKLIESLEKVE